MTDLAKHLRRLARDVAYTEGHAQVMQAAADALDAADARRTYIDVVIDGPPEHEAGRFVEVEAPDGSSIAVGSWIDRRDGYWALRIPVQLESPADLLTRRARRDAAFDALYEPDDA